MRQILGSLLASALACLMAAASSDAQTVQTTYVYDDLGRLKSASYGTAGSSQYVYDASGNRQAVVTVIGGTTAILGTPGADTLTGTSGDDHLFGFDGNDSLSGGSGNDRLEGGLGTNTLTGGPGVDLAAYTLSSSDLWVDLSAGVYSGTSTYDTFVELEGIHSGTGNDSLFGDAQNNTLIGGAGADTIVGRSGADRLEGGTGDDWLNGEDGADRLIGGGGVDYVTGGADNDVFDCAASTWTTIADFTSVDRISLGGYTFSGLVVGDYDADGQSDDTLLGFAGGNIVVRNVSSYSLATWNSLLVT